MRLPALKHLVEAVHALAHSERICVLGSSALLGSFPELGEANGPLELSFDADLLVQPCDEQLAAAIRSRQTDRVRYAARERVPAAVLLAGGEAGGCVISPPVSGEGRLEMLWYLREQSISTDYHRYGNLGVRAAEKRAEVL